MNTLPSFYFYDVNQSRTMPSQLPSQTLPHHHHCHCHCFPLPNRHHHHHLLFTKFNPSRLLCPCALHHNRHHHHHFNGCSSILHPLAINPRVILSIPPNPCPVPAGFFCGCPTVSTAVETSVSESGTTVVEIQTVEVRYGASTYATGTEEEFNGFSYNICIQAMDQSEVLKLEDPGEEEELEDVFVLTDEWREFFAKSEAKRRMDKQQKNKHRK